MTKSLVRFIRPFEEVLLACDVTIHYVPAGDVVLEAPVDQRTKMAIIPGYCKHEHFIPKYPRIFLNRAEFMTQARQDELSMIKERMSGINRG